MQVVITVPQPQESLLIISLLHLDAKPATQMLVGCLLKDLTIKVLQADALAVITAQKLKENHQITFKLVQHVKLVTVLAHHF